MPRLRKRSSNGPWAQELTLRLGYEKGQVKLQESENHRNGSGRKRITIDDDMLELSIARDRNGIFDPVLIAKGIEWHRPAKEDCAASSTTVNQ